MARQAGACGANLIPVQPPPPPPGCCQWLQPRDDLQRLRPRAPTRYESSHRLIAAGKRAAALPLPGPASAPRAQRKALGARFGDKAPRDAAQTACLPRATRTAGLPLEVLHLRRARATRCIRLPALSAPDCTDAPGVPTMRSSERDCVLRNPLHIQRPTPRQRILLKSVFEPIGEARRRSGL